MPNCDNGKALTEKSSLLALSREKMPQTESIFIEKVSEVHLLSAAGTISFYRSVKADRSKPLFE